MNSRVQFKKAVDFTKEVGDFLVWLAYTTVGKDASPLGKKYNEYKYPDQYYEKMELSRKAGVSPERHRLDDSGNLVNKKTGEVIFSKDLEKSSLSLD